jgi:hypothetical protein
LALVPEGRDIGVPGAFAAFGKSRMYRHAANERDEEKPDLKCVTALRSERAIRPQCTAASARYLRRVRDFEQQGVHCLSNRCRSCRVGYTQHERGSHSGVVERKSGAREICLLIHDCGLLSNAATKTRLAGGRTRCHGTTSPPILALSFGTNWHWMALALF